MAVYLCPSCATYLPSEAIFQRDESRRLLQAVCPECGHSARASAGPAQIFKFAGGYRTQAAKRIPEKYQHLISPQTVANADKPIHLGAGAW